MSPEHVPATQSELLRTTHPEAAALVASVSASQDAAEQYSLHNGQSSPLLTMEVLALLFPQEQSPAAAAALSPTALTVQHSSAVTQPPATAAAPTAKAAAPTAAPIASAPAAKTTDDNAAADHLAPAAASALALSLSAEPTPSAAAAAAEAEKGAATAAATDTGGAVAALVPLSTAASLFATTDPAARCASAAEAADGANDSTADAHTGRTLLLLVLFLLVELSCCHDCKE